MHPKHVNKQEPKPAQFPSELLRPSNPLARIVMRLADSIDPDLVDPKAVLCETHASLNPWVLRRLFLAVAYEATVHSDAIRSWEGRMDIPALSAFVGRLDAIAALWTKPRMYHECYSVPPFDNHLIYVASECEACILGAVGASARVLADLRAIGIDRLERRLQRKEGRKSKPPGLVRVVESWIDHLKEERAAECRAMSDEVLIELRATRHEIREWRNQQKRAHQQSRAARRSMYQELRRTASGQRLCTVPTDARHKRRTRHGIPVAYADREGAEVQRRVAMYSNTEDVKSIYRPDSMCNDSQIHARQKAAYDLHARPGAPEPVRTSASTQGQPTGSFIERFEREAAVYDSADPYDDYEEEEQAFEERDFEQEERSRIKVRDWYASRLGETTVDLTEDDHRSAFSMIHPAFQPTTAYSAPSAVPVPLKVKKDRNPSTIRQGLKIETGVEGADTHHANSSAMWTDATVYTVDPTSAGIDMRSAPPVPQMPSEYREQRHQVGDGNRTPTAAAQIPRAQSAKLVPSIAPGTQPQVSPIGQNPDQSTIEFPAYLGPFDLEVAAEERQQTRSPAKKQTPPINWPAPPSAKPMQKPTKKYLFPDSEVGSRLTTHDRQYLKSKHGLKTFSKDANPFTRAGSQREAGRAEVTRDEENGIGGNADHSKTPSGSIRHSQPQPGDQGRTASAMPSMSSSHGNTIDDQGLDTPKPTTATMAVEDKQAWRRSWGVANEDEDEIRPDDSASNVMWRRQTQVPDDITQLGAFLNRRK